MVARTGNVTLLLPHALAYSAWVLAQLGETREARVRLRESQQLLELQASFGVASFLLTQLGRTCLLLGRLDEAQRLGDRAAEPASSQPGHVAHALLLLGDIASHPDRFDAEQGEARYRAALALAEPRGMRPLQAHCRLGLGKLYRRIGRPDEARAELQTAVAMLREMGMRFWLPEAERELAKASR